jgi:hypothetical protein
MTATNTNGFLFASRAPSYDPPGWLAALTDRPSLLFPTGGTARWGLAFGQKKFTPEDTLARNPDPRDRPYAGWLCGALTLHSHTAREMGTLELQLGIVGPGALGEMGAEHHARPDEYRPCLWLGRADQGRARHQPGAAPPMALQPARRRCGAAVRPRAQHRGRPRQCADLCRRGHDAALRHGARADFGLPRARPVSAGSIFFQPTGRFGWYAFLGVEGGLVAQDITLDGNTWRDSRSVEREPVLGDASLGVALVFPTARLTATYTLRSKEFETQREVSQFGALSVAFRF